MVGETKNKIISIYQAPQAVMDLTGIVKKNYAYGIDVLHRSWPELNNYSVIERMNKDQRTFQSFVDESVEDPNEAWKWRGTRSLARRKAFALHSHLTSSYVVPNVFPQNNSQEDDRAMASGMKDIIEWETINSNYRSSYLLATMGMLVNPAVFMEIDYCEVYQDIFEKGEQGYKKSEILDEILSGVNCRILSADQILITNVYEQNIQKQKAIIKRRWVEKDELQAKYGKHDNWQYLEPGKRMVFDEEMGLFYEVKDDEHPNLVEEITWLNRRGDAEVCFLNGIYFGNENVEINPIRHRDNRNAPKYNIAPFGYHRINEHFFYFASLMFEVGWDDKLIDAMWEVEMNRGFLDVEQPVVASGFDNVDTSVMFPGSVLSTQDPTATVRSILPARSRTLFENIREVEDSMSEATLSETQQATLPEASQKATTIASIERNAKILLSGTMKSLGESVAQIGALLVDVALQHLTAPQIDEITGNLKYREFVLENKIVGGKNVSKKIRFDDKLMGKKMNETGKKMYGMKLLEEIGYPDNKESIYVFNPRLFSKTKYLIRIEADEMFPKNSEFEKVIMERLYTLLQQNPNIDLESLTRELLLVSRPQSVDSLMKKTSEIDIRQILGNQKQLPAMPKGAMTGMTQ